MRKHHSLNHTFTHSKRCIYILFFLYVQKRTASVLLFFISAQFICINLVIVIPGLMLQGIFVPP